MTTTSSSNDGSHPASSASLHHGHAFDGNNTGGGVDSASCRNAGIVDTSSHHQSQKQAAGLTTKGGFVGQRRFGMSTTARASTTSATAKAFNPSLSATILSSHSTAAHQFSSERVNVNSSASTRQRRHHLQQQLQKPQQQQPTMSPSMLDFVPTSDTVPKIGHHEVIYVKEPTKFDVLLGRGIFCQKHYGNRRFHKILEQYKVRYCSGTRRDKTLIADEIVNSIQNCGEYSGRFLKKQKLITTTNPNGVTADVTDGDEGCWFVVADAVARHKVSHAIRDNFRNGKWKALPASTITTNEDNSTIRAIEHQLLPKTSANEGTSLTSSKKNLKRPPPALPPTSSPSQNAFTVDIDKIPEDTNNDGTLTIDSDGIPLFKKKKSPSSSSASSRKKTRKRYNEQRLAPNAWTNTVQTSHERPAPQNTSDNDHARHYAQNLTPVIATTIPNDAFAAASTATIASHLSNALVSQGMLRQVQQSMLKQTYFHENNNSEVLATSNMLTPNPSQLENRFDHLTTSVKRDLPTTDAAKMSTQSHRSIETKQSHQQQQQQQPIRITHNVVGQVFNLEDLPQDFMVNTSKFFITDVHRVREAVLQDNEETEDVEEDGEDIETRSDHT